MAETQHRYFEWKTPMGSANHGIANQGFLPKGVYKGFNTITNGGGIGINLTLSHTDDFKFIKSDQTFSANTGIVVTPQGKTLYIEGSPEPLNINVGGGTDRIDLLIMEHEIVEIVGGSPAVFSVVQGASDGTVPVLPSSTKQVILAYVYVGNGINTFNGLTFSYPETPLFNNLTGFAFLDRVQQFISTQALQKEGTVDGSSIITVDGDNSASVTLNPDGNYFVLPNWGTTDSLTRIRFIGLTDGLPPEGTEITFKCSHTFAGVNREAFDDSNGFALSDNFTTTSTFNTFQAGDIFKVRYHGLNSEDEAIWNLVSASQCIARAVSSLNSEVNTLQGEMVTLLGEMDVLVDEVESLETIGFSLSNPTLITSNAGTVSGWTSSENMLYLKDDFATVSLDTTLTLSDNSLTLTLNLSSVFNFITSNIDGGLASIGAELISGDPVVMQADHDTNSIIITKTSGLNFAAGSIRITGQVSFFANMA